MNIQEVYEERRKLFARLMADIGRGAARRLADHLDVHESYPAQLKRGDKPISDDLARQIERWAGVKLGTLDPGGHIGEEVVPWEREDELPPSEYAFIQRLDIRSPGGPGSRVEEDHESYIQGGQAFRRSWLDEHGLKPENLRCVYCSGDSMEPMIQEGAPMLVDLSKKEIRDGRPYVLRYDDELRTKLLYRRPGGGLTLQSVNPAYPPIHLSPEEIQFVEVVGQVVWNASAYL